MSPRATAATVTAFMDKLVARMPFPIQAIKIDGGSEFMVGFERARQNRGGLTLRLAAPVAQAQRECRASRRHRSSRVLRALRRRPRAARIILEVVNLPNVERGFVLLPRRWVVERDFG